ncbi:PstS family phosphate ABC transporter substrate-binding protein [Nostoc commune]|uniref:PstS family phosphate ABC transporter substrate-binding protein n=1 Tax=Nostoc commune TaxID=1178 RepID=UPI0018C4D27A|nr:substrate-binding domain-containing protein [Nostoc commune]MBG1259707.1 hypothetical protein [Nostoc commune BAE]MBG1262425.1 hypothetical protein [Nostoc commune BAE]
MAVSQVLTAANAVVTYINRMYINEGNILQLDVKEIHKEIENFHQEIWKLIEQKMTEIKQGKDINITNNFNFNISQNLNINEIAKSTKDLVSKLTEKSQRIKNESTDSEELLSYFKAIEKYFELFQKETFEEISHNQHNQPIRKKIVTRLLGLNRQNNITQEESEALEATEFLNIFKNTLYKHYLDIKIKYIDLDHELSKHWTSRTLKKIFYKFKKNPLQMTALLLGSTTIFIGSSILVINNYSNINLYIKYINLPKKQFLYSQVGTWDNINKEIIASKELAKLKLIPEIYAPGIAVDKLIKSEIDFIQSISPPSSEQDEKAKARGIKLKTVPVGYYLIAIAVNQDLKIQIITIPQLRKIYTGEINNWEQLDGQNLKITPYKLGDKHPNTIFFKESVLGGKDFSNQVVTLKTNTLALKKLKEKGANGGIYFGSASEIVDQCSINTLSVSYAKTDKAISSYQEDDTYDSKCLRKTRKQSVDGLRENYLLRKQIYVIYREDDKNSIGDFYSSWLLSEKGQKLIKNATFIPIK